jgi:hypothetical protein
MKDRNNHNKMADAKNQNRKRRRGREKNVNPDGWMDGWICFVDPGRRPSVQESFVGDVDIVDILPPPCTHRRRACLCRESICVCTSVAVAKGYLFGRH